MSVLQWNIRGLKTNYVAGLSLLLNSLNPSVVCLQETKLPQDFKNITGSSIPGYSSYHHIYTGGEIACGGSSICIQSKILHRKIELITPLQAIACRVTLHKPVTICSLYIPPDFNLNLNQLDNLINQLPTPFYILGDFNAHNPLWGSDNINSKGKIIEDLLSKSNLSILNDGSPTYLDIGNHTESMIDLSLCSPDLTSDSLWSTINDPHHSDHYPIYINQDIPSIQPIPKCFNFKKANWNGFKLECSNSLNQTYIKTYEEFIDTLYSISETFIPKTSPKARKNKSWYNQDCKTAIKKKKETLNKFLSHPSTENEKLFKIARANARKIVRQSKRNSFKKYASKINNKTPISKVFKMIKKFKGTYKEPLQHIKTEDSFAETDKDVANEIASALSKNSSSQNYNKEFIKNKNISEKKKLDFSSTGEENYNSKFSLRELEECIKELNDSAPGPDEIHNKIIQNLPLESKKLLLEIFNDIWTSQRFPDAWRLATIIPIPKPGKDHTNPSNYRPIALTSCLCKLLEKLIQKRLAWFLEINESLSPLQSGYRKNRSTLDHLTRLESFIRDAFVNGEHLSAIFFDLEKAFDTTWKFGIMKDLHNLGLRGNLPKFIENFLKNRSFNVKVGSALSDPSDQEEGVPQGSILSPLLFEIKINSITNTLKKDIDSSLYVDDFLILYKSKAKIESIERQLQQQLKKLEIWANENGFKFSPTKTVAVHFCRKTSCLGMHNLTLYNNRLPVKNETKFLGVIFDKKLSFLPHIKNLKIRCKSALNALKIFSHPEWGGDTETLLHIYRSLVRSKIDYASQIYGSARPSYIKMLDPIQNEGLRLCLGAFRTSPIPSLQAEAYEPPLHIRRNKLSLHYAVKLSSNPKNPAFKSVFGNNRTKKLKYDKSPREIKPFGLRIAEDLKELDLTKDSTIKFTISDIPFWQIKEPKIDLELTKYKKDTTPPVKFKKEYKNLIKKYPSYETIFTDGSKSDSAVGLATVHVTETEDFYYKQRLPFDASISSAEIGALQESLKFVKSSTENKFLILSDSLSCLQALQQLNPKDIRIACLKLHIHYQITKGKKLVFSWIPSHIGIEGNELADSLAKEALELEIDNRIKPKLPFSDFRPKVNELALSRWKTEWNQEKENKLYKIKPNLKPRTSSHLSRKDDVVLTRLKIGHTKMTHKHLFLREEAPICEACNLPLTVEHILIKCTDLNDVRMRFYRYTNMKALFNDGEPQKIFGFLKEIGLYGQI